MYRNMKKPLKECVGHKIDILAQPNILFVWEMCGCPIAEKGRFMYTLYSVFFVILLIRREYIMTPGR